MNLTLKDIAQAMGVSVTTVSKALKDYKDISPETKTRIRAYTEKVNFRPNAHASFLRTQKTRLIGLVLPRLKHDFFNEITESIICYAASHDYKVIVLCSEESYEKEKSQIKELLQLNVDGIFISVAKNTNDYTHLKQVIKNNTPLILFDRTVKLVPSLQVVNDDFEAGFMATEHLIKQGCKKIVHLRGDLIPQISIDRFFGYKKALEKHNIPFKKELVTICSENTFEEGYKGVFNLIKKFPDVDGLFAITDLVAIGAMGAFKELGYQIPKDVAIIGYSNWLISSLITPKLSTIEQNGNKMGKQVMQSFLDLQNTDGEMATSKYQRLIIPSRLIPRTSSMKTTELL